MQKSPKEEFGGLEIRRKKFPNQTFPPFFLANSAHLMLKSLRHHGALLFFFFFSSLLVVESHFKSFCESMTQLTLHYTRRLLLCCIWQKILSFLLHFIHHPLQIKKRECDVQSSHLAGVWLNAFLSNSQLCQMDILKNIKNQIPKINKGTYVRFPP